MPTSPGRPSRPRRTVVAIAAATVLAVVAGACSGSTETTSASSAAISNERPAATTADAPAAAEPVGNGFPDGWAPQPLDWRSCDLPRGGECADLQVPLDWDDPDGATLDLALGRIPATGERVGALEMNPGGPGGSGLGYLGADPVSPDLKERFDLVSWDPRGVGASNPPVCGADTSALVEADPDPDSPEEQRALDDAAAAIAAECGRSDGALLPHLGTMDVARDLEAIRLAMGDEPLNYLGFSYGTHIGQQYATVFPDRVRAMTLDGVVDPTLGFDGFLLGQTQAFDRSFALADEACTAAGAPACGVASLSGAYDQIAAAVEIAPLPGGGAEVGPAVLATAAIQTSYRPDGWQRLGPALGAALDGDGSRLWDLAASYWDFGGYSSYAAVVCIDQPPPSGTEAYRKFAERARAVSPRLGGSVANELLPCATWPAPPVGDPAPLRALGAPTILVVGNTEDAATPYENAVTVAETLDAAVLLTVERGGHTAYGRDQCATEIIDAYLIDLALPAEGTRCP